MKYCFELTEAESINVTNTLERIGNRLMDVALVTGKIGDLEREIRDLKEDLKHMERERSEMKSDVREARNMCKMISDKIEVHDVQ